MAEQEQQHQDCTNRFIALANQMKDEGVDMALVSGALMTASGVYATFLAAGNNGTLEPSGVKKVMDLYQKTLERFQEVKKNALINQTFG